MMLLGFNMLLWTTRVTDGHYDLLAKVKQAGYDGAELPIFAADPEAVRRTGQALKDEGLRARALTVIPDPDPDPEHDCATTR